MVVNTMYPLDYIKCVVHLFGVHTYVGSEHQGLPSCSEQSTVMSFERRSDELCLCVCVSYMCVYHKVTS